MALGAVTATIPVAPKWQAGMEFTSYGYYSIGAAVAQNDTITFTDIIPAGGVEIMDVELLTPAIDSNSTPTATWIVGDSGDDNRFIDAVYGGWNNTKISHLKYGINVASTSGGAVATGAGYRYTAKASLIAKINAAVATAASTGFVGLAVRYRCSGTV